MTIKPRMERRNRPHQSDRPQRRRRRSQNPRTRRQHQGQRHRVTRQRPLPTEGQAVTAASMRAVIQPSWPPVLQRPAIDPRPWLVAAPRRKKNGAPGGIALKPCGDGCQKSTSSGGSTRWRKWLNRPKSALAMNAAVATRGVKRPPLCQRQCSRCHTACLTAPRASPRGTSPPSPPLACAIWPTPHRGRAGPRRSRTSRVHPVPCR